MIKVLVVDDSATAREYLTYIINSDPDMQVIGTACNGEEALDFLRHKRPDVITMDINMPKMNGLEATLKIMEDSPMPIIIVTASWDARDIHTTFRAMEAGALVVLERPAGLSDLNYKKNAGELIQNIKLMSEVKVVRRWKRKPAKETFYVQTGGILKTENEIKVVAIGASTGGPVVIYNILSGLPKEFMTPILIVQHMAPGFMLGFVDWLDKASHYIVSIASHGNFLQPGHAYIAPDGFHMGVEMNGRIFLNSDEAENHARPSVSYLFRSVANAYRKNAIGLLLTGMGKDGANELKVMKDKGAITIAQNRETSIVFGMPGEAITLGATDYVLPAEEISKTLYKLVNEAIATNKT
jgi:two-component system, chemotaxis family, protein-glutamate methylesterase/glutaminase